MCTVHVHLSQIVSPKITVPPSTHIVKSSSNVTFICVVNAKPRARIQWINNRLVLINDNKTIITNETNGNCSITDPPSQCETNSTLTIINAEPHDSGEYTCNATNEGGYVERSATLSVDGMYVCLYVNYVYIHCTYIWILQLHTCTHACMETHTHFISKERTIT